LDEVDDELALYFDLEEQVELVQDDEGIQRSEEPAVKNIDVSGQSWRQEKALAVEIDDEDLIKTASACRFSAFQSNSPALGFQRRSFRPTPRHCPRR
jgi:hypothetical protein